ncbi:hypothetical protein [Leptolyngbya ohadii]|uniref:hypothetical protein n=1 Tax=Leptolyngbya ohadii TaxID=1962290 RepID=UPI000B59A6AC|nr:hypothetical protein [Leptolyngbya ohadii]
MARKSKGFGELLNQKRQAKGEQESMEQLAQRVQQNFQGKIGEVKPTQAGEVRMSDVLEEFVAPYLDTAHNYDQRLILFTIASFAWNIALMPEDQQQSEIEKILGELVRDKNQQATQDTKAMLEELVERKRTSFAHVRRTIIDFELRESRGDIHLSVVSSPAPANSK